MNNMVKHAWYLIICCYKYFLKIFFLLTSTGEMESRFLNNLFLQPLHDWIKCFSLHFTSIHSFIWTSVQDRSGELVETELEHTETREGCKKHPVISTHSSFQLSAFKTLCFSFSSPFPWWLVEALLCSRHSPTLSVLWNQVLPPLKSTFPLAGKWRQKWLSFNSKVTVTSKVMLSETSAPLLLQPPASSSFSLFPHKAPRQASHLASKKEVVPAWRQQQHSNQSSLFLSAAFRTLQGNISLTNLQPSKEW